MEVVSAIASGGIQSATSISNGVARSRDASNSGSGAASHGVESVFVGGNITAVITESYEMVSINQDASTVSKLLTPKNVLSIGVEVNVNLNALAAAQLISLRLETLNLGRVSRSATLEGLRARVGRCTTGKLPFVGPVAVLITADARAARQGLTVLSP